MEVGSSYRICTGDYKEDFQLWPRLALEGNPCLRDRVWRDHPAPFYNVTSSVSVKT